MASVNNANTYHNFLRGTELYYGNKKVRPILPFMIKKKKADWFHPPSTELELREQMS